MPLQPAKDIFAKIRDSARRLSFGGPVETATETEVTSAFSETSEAADTEDINLAGEIKELAEAIQQVESREQLQASEKVEDGDEKQEVEVPGEEEEVPEPEPKPLEIKPRPAYKQRLGTYLRQRFSFKKNSTQILATEDAGISSSKAPVALAVNFSNQTVVSVPIKTRLATIAQVLGLNCVSVAIHCVIFMLSFWLVNFLLTYYFPTPEDEKVKYFYSFLTSADVDSLQSHAKNYQNWMVWPRFQPELAAMMLTVAVSSLIAKARRRPGMREGQTAIPLLKLC